MFPKITLDTAHHQMSLADLPEAADSAASGHGMVVTGARGWALPSPPQTLLDLSHATTRAQQVARNDETV